MRLAIASDHAGFELKKVILQHLKEKKWDVADLGAYDTTPSDYPDFAVLVGDALREGRADRGILVCGSGVGVSVAANKIPGVRAGLCHDTYSAHQGVEHDDMNVLVLGARIVGVALAKELMEAFLRGVFTREERHMRRLKKVAALEERFGKSSHKELAK